MCEYKADKASYRNRGGLVQKIISWMYQSYTLISMDMIMLLKKQLNFVLPIMQY